jgi:hypothetical protein
MATFFHSCRSSVHPIYHNDLSSDSSTKIYPDIKDPNIDNLLLSHLFVVHLAVLDKELQSARLSIA